MVSHIIRVRVIHLVFWVSFCMPTFVSPDFIIVICIINDVIITVIFPGADVRESTVASSGHEGVGGNGAYAGSSGPPQPQRRGALQLWQFLVTLLDDPNNASCIVWTGRGMEFKLVEPEEV